MFGIFFEMFFYERLYSFCTGSVCSEYIVGENGVDEFQRILCLFCDFFLIKKSDRSLIRTIFSKVSIIEQIFITCSVEYVYRFILVFFSTVCISF